MPGSPQAHGLVLVEIGPGFCCCQVQCAFLFFRNGPCNDCGDDRAPQQAKCEGIAGDIGIVLEPHESILAESGKIGVYSLAETGNVQDIKTIVC